MAKALILSEAAQGGHRTPSAAGGVENSRWQEMELGESQPGPGNTCLPVPGDWKECTCLGWIGSLEEGSCCSGRHLAKIQGCQ